MWGALGFYLLLSAESVTGIHALGAQEIPVVLVHTAGKGRLERIVRQSATLHPFEEVAVHAKVSGYVREVRVDLGARVETGQVLAVLDLPEEESELLMAQAEIKTAGAQLKKASANIKLKQAVLDLTKSLFEKQGRTQFQLDEAQSDLELAVAELDLARARLEEAGARVKKAAVLVDFGQVRAPFSGVITKRLVDTGALVKSGASGEAKALFVAQRTDRLRCRVEIPERDVIFVLESFRAKTLAVKIVLDALPAQTLEMEPAAVASGLARFSSSVHPESHHMLAEFDVVNDERALLPGLFGKATIEARSPASESVVLVANTAIQAPRRGKPFVYVVKEEPGVAKLEERFVELGLSDGTRIEVLSGLLEGERVVVRGGGGLVQGQSVSVRSDAPAEGKQ
jgi:RND family efflux transporter MFP subunit